MNGAHIVTARIRLGILSALAEHANANQAQNQHNNSNNHAQRTGDNTTNRHALTGGSAVLYLHQGNNTQNHADQTQRATENQPAREQTK